MPLYEFACESCDHHFDAFLTMDNNMAPTKKPCPECKEMGVYRVYSVHRWVDPGILKADRNMEKSGVLNELNRIKEHHPNMRWKG